MRCTRCNTPLHYRKRNGIARAWALLITAMICYVPANVFPVAYTNILGHGADSTIFGGIVDFWRSGSPELALLIFVASVVVPTGKFLSLGVLLIGTQRASTGYRPERARLYRLLEIVGHWSMLDVLVVGWASALGNFGVLSAAEPRVGILFFGLVVILTILSANSFDPRAIWDSKKHD
jgi:paraquat-inducible protein A